MSLLYNLSTKPCQECAIHKVTLNGNIHRPLITFQCPLSEETLEGYCDWEKGFISLNDAIEDTLLKICKAHCKMNYYK